MSTLPFRQASSICLKPSVSKASTSFFELLGLALRGGARHAEVYGVIHIVIERRVVGEHDVFYVKLVLDYAHEGFDGFFVGLVRRYIQEGQGLLYLYLRLVAHTLGDTNYVAGDGGFVEDGKLLGYV